MRVSGAGSAESRQIDENDNKKAKPDQDGNDEMLPWMMCWFTTCT
jgi:hypothetical protein